MLSFLTSSVSLQQFASSDSEEEVSEDVDDGLAVNTDSTTVASLRAYLEDCVRRGVKPNLEGSNVEQMASRIWEEESRGVTDGVLKARFENKKSFDKWTGCKKNKKGNKVTERMSNLPCFAICLM